MIREDQLRSKMRTASESGRRIIEESTDDKELLVLRANMLADIYQAIITNISMMPLMKAMGGCEFAPFEAWDSALLALKAATACIEVGYRTMQDQQAATIDTQIAEVRAELNSVNKPH